jgi:toxin HigB-1
MVKKARPGAAATASPAVRSSTPPQGRSVNPEHVRKLRQILGVLHAAETVEALNVPTFRPHPLKGNLKGYWAVTVRANWRVVFGFENGKAFDVDLIDYH